MAFVTDAAALMLQAVVFSFMSKLIDPQRLPEFGGHRASYMEFVAVGISLAAFVQLGLGRVAQAIRQEQAPSGARGHPCNVEEPLSGFGFHFLVEGSVRLQKTH